jgi:hypothetical protein
MSAFDGLVCQCGTRIGEKERVQHLEHSDMGYPVLDEEGFWEYLYICPVCGRQYWRPMMGADYSNEGWGINQ